ncbi:MAG: hypothetical protein P8H57_04055 [Emcibacteraceae bacterium]|nr:hypothetical protein [Emcibacteraceae bacterium]
MSEENVITCKIEDIYPLNFTLNAARFKPNIGLSFINGVFSTNKRDTDCKKVDRKKDYIINKYFVIKATQKATKKENNLALIR